MKENYTHIVVFLDKSGSIRPLKNDFLEGYNGFLAEQKKAEGTATITLVQFHTFLEYTYKEVDIQEAPELLSSQFVPVGMTALNDSLVEVINETGQFLKNLKEEDRPSKVLFQIITDGEENASRKFKASYVKEMIKHQEEKYGWEFSYVGANQDSFAEAQTYAMGSAMNFEASSLGVKKMFKKMSVATASYRSMATTDSLSYSTILHDVEKAENAAKHQIVNNNGIVGTQINIENNTADIKI